MAAPPAPAAADISAVSLKLPTFWPERAAVWFVQAEAQFATRNVTADNTKFHYIVSALDQDTATRVIDMLLAPPAEDKYDALKTRLLTTFSLSDAQRAAQLLDMPGLGDDKPSQLMDKMLALLGDHTPCFLFREIFLRRLPVDIRAHIVNSTVTDFRAMALAADALWAANGAQINAIRRGPVHDDKCTGPASSRSLSTPSRAKRPNDSGYCYYHARFGAAARQCRPPCQFPVSGNGQAGRQ